MDELKGNENCNAENAFQEVKIQLRFHGFGLRDKHFGENAQPSFTYVFSYFYPSIVPARCYIRVVLWTQNSLFIFLTGKRIALRRIAPSHYYTQYMVNATIYPRIKRYLFDFQSPSEGGK